MDSEIIVYSLISFTVSFILVFVLLPQWIKFAKRKGLTGTDIHKPERPEVAEMGGVVGIIVFIVVIFTMSFFVKNHETRLQLWVLSLGVLITYLIGIWDDLKTLSAIKKPVLLIFASAPVFLFHTYYPRPIFPLIGETRMTIIYLFLLPFVVAVPANAVNMLDVLNGSMLGSAIIITIGIILSVFIIPAEYLNQQILMIGSFVLLGVLLAMFYYNKYPAKVFNGDTGSLGVGAILGLLAVLGRLEFIILVALIPQITNSFSILSSIKGLKERRSIERPVEVLPDGKIFATDKKSAPITLVRLITAVKPLSEKSIVYRIWALTIFSTLLAVFSALIIRWSLV